MKGPWMYYLAKGLEGLGMIIVLVGVLTSIQLGIGEKEGFESMKAESYGLAIGGLLFVIFAGGGELKLKVECIDLILADHGEPRATDKTPIHPDEMT